MTNRNYKNSTNSVLRRIVMMALIVVTVIAALGLAMQPMPAKAQSESDPWNEAINLSASGSASRPVIAAEPDGRVHVLWWDKFDGTKYTFTRADGTWTVPVTIPVIVGLRQRTQLTTNISPPEELTVLADGDLVHAFWRNSVGDLMYSRVQSGSTGWSAAARLVTAPLVWNVSLGPGESLNLAFIRASTVAGAVPGVYYRRAVRGANWSEPTSIYASLYFRTQPLAEASISVISNDARKVLVAWNDPQTAQSYTVWSDNAGGRFSEPELVDGGNIVEAALPRNTRFLSLPDGKFLRLWEAGGSCVLYQQVMADDNTWAAPTRVLDQLNGCLRGKRVFTTSDTELFMTVGTPGLLNTLVAWDGLGWSAPITPQAIFLSPAGDLVTLGCINLEVALETVTLIGCDLKGDIWFLSSKVPVSEFLPTIESSWSSQMLLSAAQADADLPAVTVDGDGRWHIMWGQLPGDGITGELLNYRRGDVINWSDTAVVQRLATGNIESPSLVIDPSSMIHAVWSGGDTGAITYSRAFVNDALVAGDWVEAQTLPAPQAVGASPNIAMGKSGKLHVVYTVPYNEDRGVYYVYSNDLGLSWSVPVNVFDAAAAGWIVVPQVKLVVDDQDNLYAVWSRAAVPNQESPEGVSFSKSVDGGTTWSAVKEISVGTDSHPEIVRAPDGTLHIVWGHTIPGGYELRHIWSPDDGETWSPSARIPGLGLSGADFGLVADSNSSVHLIDIEPTREGTASLVYLRWNGSAWVDSDRIRLQYDFAAGLGVQAAVSVDGKLGVFYRIQVPTSDGSVRYSVAFVQRQLSGDAGIAPGATFTPRPTSTTIPAATAEPTITPLPEFDVKTGSGSNGLSPLVAIGAVSALMIIVSVVAMFRLMGKIKR